MLENEGQDKELEDSKNQEEQPPYKSTSKIAMSIQKSQDHRKFITTKIAMNKMTHPIEMFINDGKKISQLSKQVESCTRHVIMVLSDKHFNYMSAKKDNPLVKPERTETIAEESKKEIGKYYKERYYLFSKYDEGIVMDTESIH